MKISAIVQARTTSERLPGKMLKDVNGKPMIEYVLSRIKQSQLIDNIIVATSSETSDDGISDFCKKYKVPCFRGDLINVASRFKSLIEDGGIDHFIRISGDSPFIDARLIDQGIEQYQDKKYEIVTNIQKRTFPRGQSFEIFKSDTFLKAYENFSSEEEFEHVTKYFYKNSEDFKIFNLESPNKNYAQINLSIDTPEDFAVFNYFVKNHSDYLGYRWEKIVDIYTGLKEKAQTLS